MRTLAMLGLALLLGACSRDATELTLIEPGLGVDQAIAAELVRLLQGQTRVTVVLVDSPEPHVAALDALAQGAADLALVSNFESYRADVVAVLPLYPTVLHIAHRADIEAENTAELLAGRSIYAGPPDSSSRHLLEQTAAALGLTLDVREYAEEGACADVMVVFAPVLPELPSRLAACGPYVLYGLGAVEDIGRGSPIDAVALLNPKLKPFVIPAGTYGALTPEPVVTLAVEQLLVARKGVGETLIYDLISEVLRLKPALTALHPGLFHRLSADFDPTGFAFVLHPGAQAFLERDAPDVYERYSGVAEVFVTLMIGLVSGFYGVARIYNRRRKNRIDRFYADVVGIRDRGLATGTEAGRRAAQVEIRALEDRAFEQLAAERLAADASFQIFISLVRDARSDLESADRETTNAVPKNGP